MNAKLLFTVALFLICGILLTSVDSCEEGMMEEGITDPNQLFEQNAPAAAGTQNTLAAQQGAQSAAQQTAASGQTSGQTTAQRSGQTTGQTSGQTSGQKSAAPRSESAVYQQGQSQNTGTTGSANQAALAPADPSQVSGPLQPLAGKIWKLTELRRGNRVTGINRQKLDKEGFGDLFTFTVLGGNRIAGKAAPNRYTTSYTAGANNALTLLPPVSTLMAPIYDPQRILEKDYFRYLASVKSWNLSGGKLTLTCSDPQAGDAVLVYGN